MRIINVHFERFITSMLLLAALTLAGCSLFKATYGPNEGRGGYDDVQIDKNTYRVRYYGMMLSRETAERYLIYRCAELTLAQGYDYFVIVDQSADEERTSSVSNSTTSEGASGSGISAKGATVTTKSTVSTATIYNPVKTIKLFKGTKPESDFKAYDARDVSTTLAPKIEWREQTEISVATPR